MWSVMYVCAFKFIVWCGVVVCEGSGEARVRGKACGGGIGAGFPSVSLCSIEFPARISPANKFRYVHNVSKNIIDMSLSHIVNFAQ